MSCERDDNPIDGWGIIVSFVFGVIVAILIATGTLKTHQQVREEQNSKIESLQKQIEKLEKDKK